MVTRIDELRDPLPEKATDALLRHGGESVLRDLAAARDKKRDIAALTMNMAISAAVRQAGGERTNQALEDAAKYFGIVDGWTVPAAWETKCLGCGADIVIGDNTADCPVCRASWPVLAVGDHLEG